MNQSPRVLGNRYEVGDLLGRGGMAEVHLGHDTRLGRVVAIKLLRTDLARDPMFQARFRREAQSAAGLNHPAIVAVYDTGEETVVESGGGTVSLPYIVMEYVEGRTLRDVLRDGKPLDVAPALEVTSGVLAALDYSHRMGIVHRDIKPANVMLTANGDVKVMDFGIARALADASATMTQTQAVIGTAQYLSPEQARGETVDARSDLYSAGCLLFELLTCRPPFVADSPVAVAYQHVRELPQAPSVFNPLIPEAVDRVVLHALAKDREARYQTAAEFRADLDSALNGRALTAAAATAALTAPPRSADATAATEYLPAGGTTRAMSPVDRTFAGDPGGRYAGPEAYPGGDAGYPGYPGSDPYARRGGDRSDGGRRAAFVLLAVAVVVSFAIAAFAVSKMVSANNVGAATISVPALAGFEQAAAEAQLQQAGLVPSVTKQASDTVPAGRVIKTDPGQSATVQKGGTVTVYVSTGPDSVTVPDIKGMSKAEATAQLTAAGLKAGAVQYVDGAGAPKDQVISTEPQIGQPASKGSQVTLNLSNGKITIPNVVGQDEKAAEDALGKAGVTNILVSELQADGQQPGTVVEQDPKPGTVAGGTKVTLYVVRAAGPTDTGAPPTDSTSPTDNGGQGNGGGSGQGNGGPGGGPGGPTSPTS